MDLTKEQIQQLALNYHRIEENTQYLSNVEHLNTNCQPGKIISCKYMALDYHSLCRIMVQISYLLFTCSVYRTDIYLSKDILELRKNLSGRIQVKKLYALAKQIQNINHSPKKKQFFVHYFKKCCVTKSKQAYGEIVVSELKNLLMRASENLKNCRKENQKSPPQLDQQQKYYTALYQIIVKYLEVDLHNIKNPKVIIQALQSSLLFRQYSPLLKITCCSIYYSIKTIPSILQILRQHKKKQLEILKKMNDKNEAYVELEQSLDNYFLSLINHNIVESPNTVNEVIKQSAQDKTQLGTVLLQNNDRIFQLRVKVPQQQLVQFNSTIYQEIKNRCDAAHTSDTIRDVEEKQSTLTVKPSYSDFLIELVTNKTNGKQLVSVKYITDVELNIENTDVVMYQCNNIPFDLISVTIELNENLSVKSNGPNTQQKKKDRVVTFKTLSNFSIKQQPLTKILLMMDLVMISAKILEPQLKKTSIKFEQYWRVEELAKKSNHITNLFIRKVSKIYNDLSIQSV